VGVFFVWLSGVRLSLQMQWAEGLRANVGGLGGWHWLVGGRGGRALLCSVVGVVLVATY